MTRSDSGLRSLAELIVSVRENCQHYIQSATQFYLEQCKREIEQVKQHWLLLPHLVGLVEVKLDEYSSLKTLNLDLGVKPDTGEALHEFSNKLTTLRRLLEGKLTYCGKYLTDVPEGKDGTWIMVTLKSEAFPGVLVRYRDRLPEPKEGRKVKCKVVEVTRKELVCES